MDFDLFFMFETYPNIERIVFELFKLTTLTTYFKDVKVKSDIRVITLAFHHFKQSRANHFWFSQLNLIIWVINNESPNGTRVPGL